MIMWFAKWLGGRNEVEETDEPARHAMPNTRPAQQLEQSGTTTVRKKATGSLKGFDPYNSGSFERRNAWERISKR
jgi:hypothetical protein